MYLYAYTRVGITIAVQPEFDLSARGICLLDRVKQYNT